MRTSAILASAATVLILAANPSVGGEPIASFGLVWDSGETLNNVWCLGVGDVDADRQIELAAASWRPGVLHLYEIAASDGCTETWNSAPRDMGLIMAAVFADTDRDGRNEILALSYATGRVLIYEQDGNGYTCVSDDIRELDSNPFMVVKALVVGDTDRNGRTEIIVVYGDIYSGTGKIAIWEQSGRRGQHTYSKVFSRRFGLSLCNAAIGDSDNDGWPEILLGATHSGGMVVNRLEYDRGAGTWVHQVFSTGADGWSMTPCVADVDHDGHNELLLGGYGAGSGGLFYVLESTGPNSYGIRFRSDAPFHGYVSALASGQFARPREDLVAAGSCDGDVMVWQYNHKRDSFDLYAELPRLGGEVQGLALADIGKDGFGELAVLLAGSVDELRLYRRLPATGDIQPPGASPAVEPRIVAQPNPFRETTVLRVADKALSDGERIDVFDCRGRRLRTLSLAGLDRVDVKAMWDGCDNEGRPAPSGVYFCRLVTRGIAGPAARVVRMR